MLLVLTGQIRTGKTRWLQGVVGRLEAGGVVCEGVLAPGRWRDAGEGAYEKLGIDNLLLPGRELVNFATRDDLAGGAGDGAPGRSQPRWRFDEDAIARVNAHFGQLAAHVAAQAQGTPRPRRLLVIDELGRLELLEGRGLTAAMDLLAQGPQGYYDLALVVARSSFDLANRAAELYGPAWQGACLVAPGRATWHRWLAPLVEHPLVG